MHLPSFAPVVCSHTCSLPISQDHCAKSAWKASRMDRGPYNPEEPPASEEISGNWLYGYYCSCVWGIILGGGGGMLCPQRANTTQATGCAAITARECGEIACVWADVAPAEAGAWP